MPQKPDPASQRAQGDWWLLHDPKDDQHSRASSRDHPSDRGVVGYYLDPFIASNDASSGVDRTPIDRIGAHRLTGEEAHGAQGRGAAQIIQCALSEVDTEWR